MKVRVILVGGFLGAGKTTLLWEVARHFSERNIKVGLITNDQATGLVDTSFLERSGGVVHEVSGSCFCCNFNGLTQAIIQAANVERCQVIVAEPVGSCTDLSATIVQPLKEKFQDDMEVAPLSVLVEPTRLRDILNGGTSGLHDSAAYILRKQLEEADVILISKIDLFHEEMLETIKKETAKRWPLSQVFTISSTTGIGVEEWVQIMMTQNNAGTHLADVDYDVYAEGEAVLGWLNARFHCHSNGELVDWDDVLERIIYELGHQFDTLGASVGHVKILLNQGDQYGIANLTGSSETIKIRGGAGLGTQGTLTINARVEMPPEQLNQLVRSLLDQVLGVEILWDTIESKHLSPGRPNPTFRYKRVVENQD